jgi:hypothetical protein
MRHNRTHVRFVHVRERRVRHNGTHVRFVHGRDRRVRHDGTHVRFGHVRERRTRHNGTHVPLGHGRPGRPTPSQRQDREDASAEPFLYCAKDSFQSPHPLVRVMCRELPVTSTTSPTLLRL